MLRSKQRSYDTSFMYSLLQVNCMKRETLFLNEEKCILQNTFEGSIYTLLFNRPVH